jgi:peptide-methionine (S)-S-oxide reductase
MRDEAVLAIERAQEKIGGDCLVVTELVEAMVFYPAENYHQNYYENHRDAPYCQLVIEPKIEKLQAYTVANMKSGK